MAHLWHIAWHIVWDLWQVAQNRGPQAHAMPGSDVGFVIATWRPRALWQEPAALAAGA